jgi:protein DGCR14
LEYVVKEKDSQEIVMSIMESICESPSAESSGTSSTWVTKYDSKKQILVKPEQTVIEEDDYTSALTAIIQRDFFPSLPKLRLQHAFLEAKEQGDMVRLEELRCKLENYNDTTSADITNRALSHEAYRSLDEFQQQYTSEDNASFNTIMKNANEKKRKYYPWLYNDEQKTMLLDYHKGSGHDFDEKGMIQTWPAGGPNSLMFHPKEPPLTVGEVLDAPTKMICHKGTHSFLGEEYPSLDQRDDAASVTSSSNVGDYGFVAATPTIVPGVDIVPMMTWGTIESTPLRLDRSETPSMDGGPVFRMQPTPQRELLGMQLSEKASQTYRKRRSQIGDDVASSLRTQQDSSQYGRSADRLPLLSPAAQNLLKKSTSFLQGDLQLRGSYNAHPRFVPGTTPSRTPVMPVTPQMVDPKLNR